MFEVGYEKTILESNILVGLGFLVETLTWRIFVYISLEKFEQFDHFGGFVVLSRWHLW